MKHLDTDRNSARIIVQVELVIDYESSTNLYSKD